MDLEGTLWALKLKRNTLLPSWKARGCGEVIMPLLCYLAWKAGLKIPPLPFASFWQITLLMGGWFGPAWGICMWFFTWKDTGIQPGTAFVSSVVAGICFGVLMAAYHWWRKVVNNLPDWDSLG